MKGGTDAGGRPRRIYALLLRLYPYPFRERFGDAMAETFEEERAEARRHGHLAVASLWLRTLVRTPVLALEERLSSGASLAGAGEMGWLGRLGLDVRMSLRSLARAPRFALGTILTVGVGIGATASLHSTVEAVLLRPLPVAAPHELVRVEEARNRYLSTGMEGSRMTVERFQRIREATTGSTFRSFAGHNFRGLSMRLDGPAFPVAAVIASGNYFEALGVRPSLGRFFTRDEEPSAVISHALWQTRFGGDPGTVGQTIHVGGQPFTIVGVTPRAFTSTVGFLRPDLWVPVQAHDGVVWERARLATFGRLAAGVTRTTAQERAGAVMSRMPPEDDPTAEIRGAVLEPMTATPPSMAGPLRGFLFMLLGAGVLVLLIAGANVAGVITARTARRSRELAVRLALGAGRGRLVREALFESALLFGAGGLLGVGLAELTGRMLSGVSLPTMDPIVVDATPEAVTIAVAMTAAVGAGIVFGLLPALQASRSRTARVLRDGGRGASAARSPLRNVFVTAQVALSVLLLVSAVLFVRTAHAGMTRDPGFSARNVVVARVDLSPHGYDGERAQAFFAELRERVEALAGVESAAWAELSMLTGAVSTSGAWRLDPEDDGTSANQNTVDGQYFETLRISTLAGRPIDEIDVAGAPPAVVVNERFAEGFWPGENPVGKTVLRGETVYRVVGLVADGTYVAFGEDGRRFAFLSLAQRPRMEQVLHVRHRIEVSTSEVVGGVRREVARLDPDVAVEDALALTQAMGNLLLPQRLAAILIGAFGLLGLFLAATGVYSVLANHVVQRTREFGIRLALGAEAHDLLRRMLRQGAVLAVVGAVVGLAAAAVLTRFVVDLLHGVSPLDPVAFVGVPLLLGLVTLAASLGPARRILGLDPVETLKQE